MQPLELEPQGYPFLRLVPAEGEALEKKAIALYAENPHPAVNPPDTVEEMHRFKQAGFIFFLLENKQGETVGACALRQTQKDKREKLAFHSNLLILPGFRGQNLGVTALYGREKFAKERLDTNTAAAAVEWSNGPARRNYLETGYKETRFPRFWLDWNNLKKGKKFFYFLRGFRKKL